MDMSSEGRLLSERIVQRTARVGVVGLGYVGLPVALTFAESGVPVTGFDVDAEKPERLRRAESYLRHIPASRIKRAIEELGLDVTHDMSRLGEPDVVLVCVPTPLTPQREPDMRYVVATLESIASRLRRGQLVVLESTTYPGTTEELARGILDRAGLECGEEYFLAFSPEREDPGNPTFETRDIPRLVGGVDPQSTELAARIYECAVQKVFRVSSARVAEAAKLLENTFRAVNIALVNELKMVYDRMGIDVWEVLDAASTKPFGFMRFDPGPGWGGHCIPVDPFYLAWKAREYGVIPRFIELAGEINVRMPEYVIGKLQDALNERGRALKGSRVLLLGLAYKRNIDDTRESPALEIIELLANAGAEVAFHDPHVREIPPTRRHPQLAGQPRLPLDARTLAEHDAVIVVTDHEGVDYDLVRRHARLVVDTRGVLRVPGVVRA